MPVAKAVLHIYTGGEWVSLGTVEEVMNSKVLNPAIQAYVASALGYPDISPHTTRDEQINEVFVEPEKFVPQLMNMEWQFDGPRARRIKESYSISKDEAYRPNEPEHEVRVAPFEQELSELINRHSLEGGSGTPDYVLAAYLVKCLTAYNETVANRAKHLGEPVNKEV